HQWTVQNPESFWQTCLEFSGIVLQQPAQQACERGEYFWLDRWFPGAKLNYAENLLRFRDGQTALIFYDECSNTQQLTYAELYRQVAQLASWLRDQGVKPGDRVAGFAANRIEAVIAMLAATSSGAVWTSCSPDFGVGGILDRFAQIKPVMLFAVSSHCYAGKPLQHKNTLDKLVAGLPSLKTVVLLPDLYDNSESPASTDQCNVLHWQTLPCFSADSPVPALEFHAADFSDP